VKCWEALADGLLDAGSLMRIEEIQRLPEQRNEVWVRRQSDKVRGAIRAMAMGLADHPYCTGNHFTLADVSIGCALLWLDFRLPQISWREDQPKLARLVDKLSDRPSFRDTRPD